MNVNTFLKAACLAALAMLLLPQAVRAQTLRVATFNIRMDTPDDGEDAWPNRKELVKALIRFHDFDIFGVQEAFRHQLDDLTDLEQYVCIGEGRDGNDQGEHAAILYKKDRFTLLEHGDFWFSETPDRAGLGWDATCCNRICSWGKFRDKQTGKEFCLFNSHFDHEGVVARRESAKLLLASIKEMADGLPVFAIGDFNATPDSEPVRILLSDGLLRDAYVQSEEPPYGTPGTYQGFDRNAVALYRIDHIFVTSGIRVRKYGVLNETPNGKFPSDHYPVMIVAEIGE